MTLTALLLMLKLLTIYVQPERASEKDDQTLATCVVKAMTERPTALVMATTKEAADVTLTVGNHAGFRIHITGTLVTADGRTLIDVDHVTHGFNHGLCNQANGLIDEMAQKLAHETQARGER